MPLNSSRTQRLLTHPYAALECLAVAAVAIVVWLARPFLMGAVAFSLPVAVELGFRFAASIRFGLALFPVPAHRTGRADFPHPALGKDSRCSV